MKLAWGLRVSEEFCLRAVEVCYNLGWQDDDRPSYLMSCMAWESGKTFSPSVKNMAGSGATGLIQFMPDTAIGQGTTIQQLERMTAVQQLVEVEKYFRPYRTKIVTLADMYMAILLPKYIAAPPMQILFTDGTKAYRQNSGFDANKDGKITKLEATSRVQALYEMGMTDSFARNL